MRRAVAALAAVLALSGCAGIPTSGGVEAGPVIDGQSLPDVDFVAQGPVPGSAPDRILTDFMQAVRSSKNDYAVAKQFMTTALAGQWNPNASTIIRTTANLSQGDDGNWLYTVASRATVNGDGLYREEVGASVQTLEFAFQQVDGEWRISSAPDGIVLSQSSFDVAFREQPLYFFDSSHRFLVPDVRWFPSRTTTPTRAVRALLAGPADWLQQGVLQTAFPIATQLGAESVDIAGNRAVVDLSVEALASDPQDRIWMRQQIAATLGVPNVTLTVAGRDLPTPDTPGEGAAIDPGVEGAALVRHDEAFGFDGGVGITALEGISETIVGFDATAAVLSDDARSVAFTGADGINRVVSAGADPVVVDSRPGLAAPSIDPFDFVWSAQTAGAASLAVTDAEGGAVPFASGLPADARVVSLDVSRDGTRLLLSLAAPAGPSLLVAGIIRENDVPVRLGPPLELPAGPDVPVDAAWVDDRFVATLTAEGDVTAFEIGGPSTALGTAAGGTTIVGGNNGTDGLRVLAGGEVWRPQGSGWVSTGIPASLLATKQ